MSMIYKKVLVAAIAMGLTSAAMAAEVVKDASTPEAYVHAWELNGNATAAANTASNAGVIAYSISSGDSAVLRAQPIKVVVKPTGAKITTLVVANAQGTAGAVAIDGTTGAASFVITPGANSLFGTGTLFSVAAGGAVLNSVPTAIGGEVSFTIELRDPTTDALIDTAAGSVMSVAQATNVTFAKNASPTKIDVATTRPRVGFVGGVPHVDLGVIKPVLADVNSAKAGLQVARGDGSGVADNVNSGLFAYATTSGARDVVVLTVTAEDGTAFRVVPAAGVPSGVTQTANPGIRYMPAATGPLLADATSCTSTSLILGATATNANEWKGNVDLTADMATYGIRVCAFANNVNPISAQTFNATAKVELKAANTQKPAAVSAALATLSYNGMSVKVNHFNPASNADQVSYLRISNTSGITGFVTIEGICDNGVASTTPARFSLDTGKSVLLTSTEIENGNPAKGLSNGLGACATGKSRLVVSGEIPTMEVQNFLRNTTSAGMINTNVNNKD